jgi:hypothetical protein
MRSNNLRSRKVNARVTPDIAEKLQEIVRATGSSMSEVIANAIEAYYAQGMRMSAATPYEIAVQSGIIGCAAGPKDLSRNYKRLLTESLEEKSQKNRKHE